MKPKHGSDQPDGFENYAGPKLVGVVKPVIEHFDYKRAIIIGHDWGGFVAWSFAMSHLEMTKKCVVMNLSHPH